MYYVQALWVGLCSDKPVKSDCQIPTQTQVVLDKLDPDQILLAPHFEQILFTAFVYKNRLSAKEMKEEFSCRASIQNYSLSPQETLM